MDEGGSEGGGPVSLSTKHLVYMAADIQKLQEKVLDLNARVHATRAPTDCFMFLEGVGVVGGGQTEAGGHRLPKLCRCGRWVTEPFVYQLFGSERAVELFNQLFSSPLDALAESRARLSSSVPSLNGRMSQHLTERCCRFLKSAAEVPRLYRRTNKVRLAALTFAASSRRPALTGSLTYLTSCQTVWRPHV